MESKPMSGGCFVCLDERGWENNALVYCDGKSCSVAVHQACYGIVVVPTGSWFCKACEANREAKTLRCSLCPYKGGALKSAGCGDKWAHVVCALYIPEVEFENVSTMEPILIDKVPSEKFALECYICAANGESKYSTYGACMTCAKSGCKLSFHVTCGQMRGLLCEVTGANSTKYCGFCEQHLPKHKKSFTLSKEMFNKLYCSSSLSDDVDLSRLRLSASNKLTAAEKVGDDPAVKTHNISGLQDAPIAENNYVASPNEANLTSMASSSTSLLAQNTSPDDVNDVTHPPYKPPRRKSVAKTTGGKTKTTSKYMSKKTGRGAKSNKTRQKLERKNAKVAEDAKYKSPVKRAGSSQKTEEATADFILSPKHSVVMLANFGEESLQASEPSSIGSSKPTPQTQNGQFDVVSAVDNFFEKQKEEYFEFISHGMNEANRAALNEFLQLRKENMEREAFLEQLKQRTEKLLAIEAYLQGDPSLINQK